MRELLLIVSLLLLIMAAPPASANEVAQGAEVQAMEEMFSSPYSEEMYYRTDQMLLTATGNLLPVHKAPAVASVITAEDIEAVGATELDQVLEMVPGLHVSPSPYYNRMNAIYSIRGVHTNLNPQVLLMVNSVPYFQLFSGSRPFNFHLPVANISRIEVIRGPGSALHGADAFAGVVNVITKDAEELQGTRAGARAGSFDSYSGWAQHGFEWKGWKTGLSFEWMQSEGDDSRIIESDQQTIFDTLPLWKMRKLQDTDASLTPGALATQYDVFNTNLAIAKDNFRVNLWSWIVDDGGLGPGVSRALDYSGSQNSESYFADVSYKKPDVIEDLDLNLHLNYQYRHEDSLVGLFPPGARLPISNQYGTVTSPFVMDPATGKPRIDPNTKMPIINPMMRMVTFPEGMFGHPTFIDKHLTLETSAFFSRIANHLIHFGLGYKKFTEETEAVQNFGRGVLDSNSFSGTVKDATMTTLTGTPYIFMMDQARELYYAYLQDEWSLARNWELTAGIRYDEYSDFGTTVNPRAALVWEARYDLTVKFLYGRAFRPPSFSELYTTDNPVVLGNPDLDPETIETFEMAFDYQPVSNLRLLFNTFAYTIEDLIDYAQDSGASTKTAKNLKNQEGYGYELEADWEVTGNFRLRGNFAYQHSENKDTGMRIPNAPRTQFYANAHWKFLPAWSLDTQFFWIGDRARDGGQLPADTRPEIDDYSLVNLTLRRKNVFKHWDAALGVRNVFDKNAREPTSTELPHDYPMEGRSIHGEVRWTY